MRHLSKIVVCPQVLMARVKNLGAPAFLKGIVQRLMNYHPCLHLITANPALWTPHLCGHPSPVDTFARPLCFPNITLLIVCNHQCKHHAIVDSFCPAPTQQVLKGIVQRLMNYHSCLHLITAKSTLWTPRLCGRPSPVDTFALPLCFPNTCLTLLIVCNHQCKHLAIVDSLGPAPTQKVSALTRFYHVYRPRALRSTCREIMYLVGSARPSFRSLQSEPFDLGSRYSVYRLTLTFARLGLQVKGQGQMPKIVF